jgi:hypothetical protein
VSRVGTSDRNETAVGSGAGEVVGVVLGVVAGVVLGVVVSGVVCPGVVGFGLVGFRLVGFGTTVEGGDAPVSDGAPDAGLGAPGAGVTFVVCDESGNWLPPQPAATTVRIATKPVAAMRAGRRLEAGGEITSARFRPPRPRP